MNELRGPLDNLSQTKSGFLCNSHKIRGLVFWQANCIQLN
jgi:hypothetical protein